MTASVIAPEDHAVESMRQRVCETPFGHVIGGLQESPAPERLDVVDPATGAAIASISKGTAEDVGRAVAAARAAFPAWRSTPPSGRAKVLNAAADAVEAHLGELAALESLNVGKPAMVARAEMDMIGDIFRFLGGAARTMQAPATQEYASGYMSMILREPVGVVGAITPWNYPLLTAVFKLAGALAAGNTVVLKPSELTPLTTLRFMELVAGVFPAGILNLVLGTGDDVGSAMSRHPDIDLMSLTGSVSSGQRVIADSTRTLKPTHLELGGKAPVVVFEDADLDAVAAAVRTAGYWNTGQECGAATRVLCQKSIAAALTDRLQAAVSTLRVGAVTEGEEVEIGPLISETHLGRVSEMVGRARAEGARILVGGERLDRPGFFYPPTLIVGTARGSEITREEIFGPVVTLETFEDESDAVGSANAVAYGLSASVWTADVGRALRMSGALDFGTVWVNSHLVMVSEMPWGGFKASGHGRELSTLCLEDFSRTKHVMIATSI